MGMFEDLSSRVDQLTHQVTCIHNRVEEVGDSSVRANERVSELEQKLRTEIESIRDQAQRWSGVRSWNEACILHGLQSFRNRVSKIEERLAPTCVKSTVTYCDPDGVKQRQNEESVVNVKARKIPGWIMLYAGAITDPVQMIDEKELPAEFPYVGCIISRGRASYLVTEVVEETSCPNSSPAPGTWAWACEQMLAGKKAENEYGLPTAIIDGKIQEQVDGEWRIAVITRADMHSSKWQVVS